MHAPDSLPRPLDWMDDAACHSHKHLTPEDWFNAEHTNHGGLLRLVRNVCDEDCPVREQCLELALTEQIAYGVWGGKTAAERRHITRKRHATQAHTRLRGNPA